MDNDHEKRLETLDNIIDSISKAVNQLTSMKQQYEDEKKFLETQIEQLREKSTF